MLLCYFVAYSLHVLTIYTSLQWLMYNREFYLRTSIVDCIYQYICVVKYCILIVISCILIVISCILIVYLVF